MKTQQRIPKTPQIFSKDFCFSDSFVETLRPYFWEKNMKKKERYSYDERVSFNGMR